MKPRRYVKKLLISTSAIVLAASLIGAAPKAQDSGGDPLELDLKTGLVAEADGTPVLSREKRGSASGEARELAVLSSGEAAIIVRQSALPTDDSLLEPTLPPVDEELVKAAREYPGILPQEMVPTEFTHSDQDLVEEGGVDAEPVDVTEMVPNTLSAVTPKTFSYTWDSVGVEHVVYRDGKEIARLTDNVLTDVHLAPGHEYVYEIVSYAADGALLANRYVPVSTPHAGAATAAPNVSLLTYQNWLSSALYRTFISDNRVSLGFFETLGCGQAFQPNRSFGGDNRGFAYPPLDTPWDSTSSRTSMFLNVNWDNPAPYDLVWVKTVGTTRLYEGTTLIESRTASDSGMVVSEVQASSAYAQARVAHSVGNPFCVAGAIQYNVMFRWYRSGTFEVVGWRQPVPHHEIYGGWDSGSGNLAWYSFGQYTNEGFGCLTGSCGTRTVNVSTTH